MKETPLFIGGSAGDLECRLFDSGDPRLVIICHPHPLFGGSMDHKIIYTLQGAFAKLGLSTLRFNYRGVGKSGGVYSGGDGESEDGVSVARALTNMGFEVHVISGFSFGGMVASKVFTALDAANEIGDAKLALIAPACTNFNMEKVKLGRGPLHVMGDEDHIVDSELQVRWSLRRGLSPVIVEGAGHFFHGKMSSIRQIVTNWYEQG